MKRDLTNIEDVVDRHLAVASVEDVKTASVRVWHRLQAGERAGDLERHVDDAAPAPVATWRPIGLAAAAVLVLAAGIWTAIGWRPGDDALYQVVERDVLALSDGSHVEMRPDTELTVERAEDGLRIRLDRGGIIVNAAEQRSGHLYVETSDMTVSVVGTVFLVNAAEGGSRVAVIEGEVRVQQGALEQTLRPGEQVASSSAMGVPTVRESIAWSRHAAALSALLKQSAVVPPALTAQNATAPLETFEVASIRPSAVSAGPSGRAGGGGGGTRRNRRGDNPCSDGGEPLLDPRRFDAVNASVIQLVSWAYGLDCWMNRGPDVVVGGPDWIRKDGYDVLATIPEGTSGVTAPLLRAHNAPVLQRMLQSLLIERFNLVTHHEMREMPVYVLSVAPGGPKFTRVNAPATLTDREGNVLKEPPAAGGRGYRMPPSDRVNPELSVWQDGDARDFMALGNVEIHGRKRTMADLVTILSFYTGRPVLDRTGLTGNFSFFFEFATVECSTCPFVSPGPDARRPESGTPYPDRPLFAVLEQVGLELKPAREQVEVLVIERVDRPSAN